MLNKITYSIDGVEEQMLVKANGKRLSIKQAEELLRSTWNNIPRSLIHVKAVEVIDENEVPPWDEVRKAKKKKKRKLTTYLDDMEAHDMEMMEKMKGRKNYD